MHFKEGTHYLDSHNTEELQKFPDKDLTIKQVQQFLGIVNYFWDFIPKISKALYPL